MSAPDFTAILRTLGAHGVEFILVGGVSAALRGVPVTTFDVDVVHATTGENVVRLLEALDELHAIYRAQPERELKPHASHLGGPGHHLLLTDFGPLDLLGMVGAARGYADLVEHSDEFDIGGGVMVRVLDLETLIATKEEAGGEKDKAALPLLRRTLEEKRRR